MIVKIEFEGIVYNASKKSKLTDSVRIHVAELKALEQARAIFESWIKEGCGLRGDSGVFHPLKTYGEIHIKSVKEVKDA